MPTEPRVLADFLGTWSLKKTIREANGRTAAFEGTAVWTAENDGALYTERGTLTLAGGAAPLSAERRYRWTQALDVFFDDGRFFHRVPDQGGQAAHWCDPDQYDVTWGFESWPCFSAKWVVRGPRKDYEMMCRYAPA
ncbi:DUF6314 family protein [uncultured Roseobacter sp.]|uniref:DUF6314 family protein n=1 Tax=uncultured Roseobacter sp. TaxID=114847 RepID=UPI00261AF0DE|nr:DUF6314 family protein [uncultured Roseobacter sp.]